MVSSVVLSAGIILSIARNTNNAIAPINNSNGFLLNTFYLNVG
jgi:hypothetical protein